MGNEDADLEKSFVSLFISHQWTNIYVCVQKLKIILSIKHSK